MKKKFYLYAGYYELYITDKPMKRPYVLLSWHKSIDTVIKAAEKRDDDYFFQEDLIPQELEFIKEDAKTVKIQNRKFIIN